MSYKALYRKYRPFKFEDIIGQTSIITIIKNSILNAKISHAYLFSGPRGTGKTSVAKIFARTVNCESPLQGESCAKCNSCKMLSTNDIDIVEIDAASNNGVDEIREIRNNVKLMPSYAKYKVYIIDEVHMLSTGAFNALLKTLEEPPEHVIFILATTEIHKIPLTILSRCQRFDFLKINTEYIVSHLTEISKKERIKIEKPALELIANLSDGGFRDAINFLDQLSSNSSDKITVEDIYNISGNIPGETVFELINTMLSASIKEGLNIINKLYSDGKNFKTLTEKLLLVIRDIVINNNSHDYFEESYKSTLSVYSSLDTEKANSITKTLINMSNDLKSSVNQKILFEINYLYIMNSIMDKTKEDTRDIVVDIKEPQEEKNEVSIQVDNELINLRVNNALSAADKTLKNKFIKKIEAIEEYVSNMEYNLLANLILKTQVGVVSNDYAIFILDKISDVSIFMSNLKEIELLIEKVTKKRYKLAAINQKEWNKVIKKYIENRKNGVEYSYIEESEIKEKSKLKQETMLEKTTKSLFGDDIINYE